MKVLRALLGAVALMTTAVLVFLFTISSPRAVVQQAEYAFVADEEERGESPSQPHLTSHIITSSATHSSLSSELSRPHANHTSLSSSSSSHTTLPSTISLPLSNSTITTSIATSMSQSPPAAVLYDKEMIGHLNYDIWRQPVGYLVDDLRIKRDFPSRPEVRRTIDLLHTTFNAVDKDSLVNKYGHKIYGYLLPAIAGSYQLRAELTQVTAACSVEVWLSSGSSPLSTRLVSSVQTPLLGRNLKGSVHKEQDSDSIHLEPGAYYFEFLEKAFDGKCLAAVLWKKPGAARFTDIPSDQFSMAVKLTASGEYDSGWAVAKELLNDELPSNQLQSHARVQYIGDTVFPITDLDVLESCEFTSKVAYPHQLKKQYAGVYEVRESAVFPPDQTVFMNWRKRDKGSKFITKERSNYILKLYKKTFSERGHNGEVTVRMMEETENKDAGPRFLLELDVQLEADSDPIHTSEYVYLASGADTLCHTTNFQWKRNVDVYLVVSVKNLGVWVQHLLHNMEHIYKVTRDEQFELVIVDYGSADLDVESELRASSLPRWKVISMSGGFSRSGGLQAGIDYVTDPDSIVMTIDMHLTLPPGFVEYIRRHTVQGKMGFAPMFFRLNQGYTEININGFWETLTYGLLGMYKSDWIKTGGFDTQKYTTKWGGEDWDAVDKVRSKGMELFRIRYPGLVHYFHTRTGLWVQGKIKR